jgi:hypothetical protein
MTSTSHIERHTAGVGTRSAHAAGAWTGIAFPVLFLASVLVSNAPADDASNRRWIAAYGGHSEQARHLATGVLLVLAGLCLAAFLTNLWRRVHMIQPAASPLPVVAAAVSAACIAAGGVVMAYVSGGELIGTYPLPSADVLRLSNDLGFALVAVGGMLAAALAVVVLSRQARAAEVFGRKTYVLGIVAAVALLGALAFVPVVLLGVWTIVVAVQWLRA